MGYQNLGLEYLGKTKEEIDAIEARKAESVRAVVDKVVWGLDRLNAAERWLGEEVLGVSGTPFNFTNARDLVLGKRSEILTGGQEQGLAKTVADVSGEVLAPDAFDVIMGGLILAPEPATTTVGAIGLGLNRLRKGFKATRRAPDYRRVLDLTFDARVDNPLVGLFNLGAGIETGGDVRKGLNVKPVKIDPIKVDYGGSPISVISDIDKSTLPPSQINRVGSDVAEELSGRYAQFAPGKQSLTPWGWNTQGWRVTETAGWNMDWNYKLQRFLQNQRINRYRALRLNPNKYNYNSRGLSRAHDTFIDPAGKEWMLVRKSGGGVDAQYVLQPKSEVFKRAIVLAENSSPEAASDLAKILSDRKRLNMLEQVNPEMMHLLSEYPGSAYVEHIIKVDDDLFWNSARAKELGYLRNDPQNMIILFDQKFKKMKDYIETIVVPPARKGVRPPRMKVTQGPHQGKDVVIRYERSPKSVDTTDIVIETLNGHKIGVIPNHYSVLFSATAEKIVPDHIRKTFIETAVQSALLNDKTLGVYSINDLNYLLKKELNIDLQAPLGVQKQMQSTLRQDQVELLLGRIEANRPKFIDWMRKLFPDDPPIPTKTEQRKIEKVKRMRGGGTIK